MNIKKLLEEERFNTVVEIIKYIESYITEDEEKEEFKMFNYVCKTLSHKIHVKFINEIEQEDKYKL